MRAVAWGTLLAVVLSGVADTWAQSALLQGQPLNHCGVELIDLQKLGGAWTAIPAPSNQEPGTFAAAGCRLCTPEMVVSVGAAPSPSNYTGTTSQLAAALYRDRAAERAFLDQYAARVTEPGCTAAHMALVGQRVFNGRDFIGVEWEQTCPLGKPPVLKSLGYSHLEDGCVMFAMVVWEKGDLEAHDLAILDRFFQHVRWSSDRSPQLKHLPDQQKLMDELQMMLKPSPQPQGSQIPMPPADHRL